MKKVSLLILSAIVFIGCSRNTVDKQDSGKKPPQSNAQTVKRNKSIVKAGILNIVMENSHPIAVKAKAIEVKEDANFENIAVANEVYDLKINYLLDPLGNKLKNKKNENLENLGNLKQGDTIWIEISYNPNEGWLLNNVLQGSKQ